MERTMNTGHPLAKFYWDVIFEVAHQIQERADRERKLRDLLQPPKRWSYGGEAGAGAASGLNDPDQRPGKQPKT